VNRAYEFIFECWNRLLVAYWSRDQNNLTSTSTTFTGCTVLGCSVRSSIPESESTESVGSNGWSCQNAFYFPWSFQRRTFPEISRL